MRGLAVGLWLAVLPVAGGAADTGAGAATYARICAYCHDTGIGPVLQGRALPPEYIIGVVRNGRAAMPAFRPAEIDDATLTDIAGTIARAPAAQEPAP